MEEEICLEHFTTCWESAMFSKLKNFFYYTIHLNHNFLILYSCQQLISSPLPWIDIHDLHSEKNMSEQKAISQYKSSYTKSGQGNTILGKESQDRAKQ